MGHGELTINGETVREERLADAMNTHFINAGSFVSSCETECDDGALSANTIFQSIYVQPTDPVEISNVIKQLKNNVAPGIDEMCLAEIKLVAPLIIVGYLVTSLIFLWKKAFFRAS